MSTPECIRVLHVDDEATFAELVADMLERVDHRLTVETVTSASECLDHFFEREYDCIVSDYDMPEMSGIELLERVREEDDDFPFILFTGKGSEEVASDAISAGVTDYLQKQTDSDQYTVLANRLANAVEQYRAKQRLEERERELRRKQEYLDTILEHTTTPIFMKDYEGRYVFTNRAYKEGFDIDGEIAGKTAHDIYPPEMADTIEEYDRTVLETGEPIEFEGTETIDGEERTFLTTLVPVSDTDEHTDQEGQVALFGVASDITDLKRREHELERERDRVNALFQNMADPIAYYEFEDEDPIVKEVNLAFEETFGVTGEEVHGRSIDDVLVPKEYTEEGNRINERVRAGEIVDTEVTRQAHDGLREFNLVSVPLAPGKSGEQGFTIYTDITERKERERELTYQKSLFEATIETSLDAIHVVDEDRDIVAYNDQFVELWNIPEYVLTDKSSEQALEAALQLVENPDEFVAQINYLYDHPEEHSRDRVQLTDGRVLDRYSAPVTNNGTYFGRVWIYRDITDLIKQTDELERQNERLEEFVSIISHDLRNPLNVASARVELANDECDSSHLAHVSDALDRMDTLINDLLTLAREGKEIGETTSIELATVCEDCWQTVATPTASLLTSTEQKIQADPSRLKQLLENLVRNAVEHGGKDVTVRIGDLDNGFYVADDGPGIPEDKRDEVFESGYSTTEGGTGFGLAIVEQIVEAHGWEIRVTDSDDGGARFEITILNS